MGLPCLLERHWLKQYTARPCSTSIPIMDSIVVGAWGTVPTARPERTKRSTTCGCRYVRVVLWLSALKDIRSSMLLCCGNACCRRACVAGVCAFAPGWIFRKKGELSPKRVRGKCYSMNAHAIIANHCPRPPITYSNSCTNSRTE